MLESMKFWYNGQSSEEFGVCMVGSDVGGGLHEESLFAQRKVKTETIPFSDYSIFKGVDNEPLSFSIAIYMKDWKDRNNLRSIIRWLCQDEYKPLIFESNTNHIYYAMVNGEPKLSHNGLRDGYAIIPFICDSRFSYSELHKDKFMVNGNVNKEYLNSGDVTIRPQLKLRKIGNGNITIRNNKNGQELRLTDILNNEVITINGEFEEIHSSFESITNRYILAQHNNVWLDFEPDYANRTKFTFTGNFECEFYYEYKYLNQDYPTYFL